MGDQEELQVIEGAMKLIEKPENWTQGAFARDRRGVACLAENADAVCFCGEGAVIKAASSRGINRGFTSIIMGLADYVGRNLFSHFNDTHTHAEVLAVFAERRDELRAQVAEASHA